MGLILALDIIAVTSVIYMALRKGLEQALPLAAFLFVIFPEEAKIPIPGLFDLTTQRLVVVALLVLCTISKVPKGSAPKKLPLAAGIITLASWWILSAATSVVFTVSIKYVLSQILDLFMIYYVYARFVTKTETVRNVLFGMVAGMMVCCVFGVLEVYAQWSVISLFPEMVHRSGASGRVYVDMARGVRAQSTFGHPILFGSALAMAIPMALYLVSNARKSARKVFLWIGLLLMFVCIYKTASRGPWLALALSLAALLTSSKTRLRKYLIVICLLTAVVLVARPGVWETIQNDYLSTMDKKSSQGESYQYRFALYELAAHELNKSAPRAIWGYGPESFFYLGIVGKFNGRIMMYESCDSSMAALLIETGYVGFIIAILLLYRALKLTYRAYRKLPAPENAICMIFLVNIATFCFMMTNVAIFGWGQENIMFWIVTALAMVYPYILKSERNRKSVVKRVRATDLEPSLAV